MHREIQPAIHYWGTPVVLVSTLNEDGSTNIAPMSSVWWLGWSCMLGFDASSHTVQNLRRERECVLNLASTETAAAVDQLALTTGAATVPLHKRLLGYRHVADKAALAGLSLMPSLTVRAPRVRECLVQLEAELTAVRAFGKSDPTVAVPACSVEVRIVRVHVEETLLRDERRVDAQRWRPLLMSFRELFVRGEQAVARSTLARGDESLYAPWQHGRVAALAAKGLSALSRRRYAVEEEAADGPGAD